MGRRTRRWGAPSVDIDHIGLFAEEAKAIARSAGLLDAYRKSCGLLLREIRTEVARERLARLGERCREAYMRGQYNGLLIAKEIAARHARLAWTGEWWTASPCMAEPLTLSPGDEYFARATVCRIIEQMGEPVADRVG
ncbi:MAG: hypothetical protein RIR33_2606 [Pseudomonadota bacterium]|jgi:hypothetical protein